MSISCTSSVWLNRESSRLRNVEQVSTIMSVRTCMKVVDNDPRQEIALALVFVLSRAIFPLLSGPSCGIRLLTVFI